jgi:adenylate kinase family enzyme
MEKQLGPLQTVLDHYRRAGILTTVDGRADIETVTARILAAVEGAAVR